MASLPAGNDPFSGGSITRTGQSNVAGGIPSANTSVGNPIGGVNPGAIFSARNNQGSNIGIPYTRLCPLGSKQGSALGRPPRPTGAGGGADVPDLTERVAVEESEDLRSMTLAFILGKRSGPGADGNMPYVNSDGSEAFGGTADYGFSFNTNGALAPGMPGTERFQKLCSFEYLHRYFTNFLWRKGITLRNDGTVAGNNAGGTLRNRLGVAGAPEWSTGLPRMVKAAAVLRQTDVGAVGGGGYGIDPAVAGPSILAGEGAVPGLIDAYLTEMTDLAYLMGLPGSDMTKSVVADGLVKQGIFTRDFGPFLRGKGIHHDMFAGTAGAQPQDIGRPAPNNRPVQPYHVSRCAGDELAFALFERLLEEKGFSDWRPDGIVLSKGADDPSDKLSDEYLKSRDGELFNIRVQGPAVTSTWAGDPALEVMPLDKVFVVIVADVWWGALPDPAGAADPARTAVRDFVNRLLPLDGGNPGAPDQTALRAYLAGRETELRCGTGRGLTKGTMAMPVDAAGAVFTARPVAGTADLPGLGTLPAAIANPGNPPNPPLVPTAPAPGADAAVVATYQAALAAYNAPGTGTLAQWQTNVKNPYDQAKKDYNDREEERRVWREALGAAQRAYDSAEPYDTFVKQQAADYEGVEPAVVTGLLADAAADAAEVARETSEKAAKATRLCNFRVMLATSSQMVNYSAPRYDGSGHQVCSPDTDGNEFRRVHNQSRMGLRLGRDGGEYIVGGWCIGNVLDTAASRAAFPSAGTNIGVRTAPNSMAMNLNVKVEWWDADRLWRSFMNVDGSLTPRYVQTKPLAEYNPAGVPTNTLYSAVNMPPNAAAALHRQYIANSTFAELEAAYDPIRTAGRYAELVQDIADAETAIGNAVTAADAVAEAAARAAKQQAEVVLQVAQRKAALSQIPCAALLVG